MIRLAKLLTISLCAGLPLLGESVVRPYSVMGPPPLPELQEAYKRMQGWMLEGWKIKPAEALALENELARDSENLAVRMRLISYYGQYEFNDSRVRHLLWMIEHHPDAEFFQNPGSITAISPPGSGINQSKDYPRAQELWRQQARKFPTNARVLGNAAANVEPETSLMLIEAARIAEPRNMEWTRWLAKIYADAIRWTFWDGKSMMTFTGDAEDYRHAPRVLLPLPLCSTLKRSAESSTDGALVEAIAESLLREVRLLKEKSGSDTNSSLITPDVPQLTAYADSLLARSRTLVKQAKLAK